jgi:hypothetical protein
VMESPVSMNGNRVAIVRTVADRYRAGYVEAVRRHLARHGRPARQRQARGHGRVARWVRPPSPTGTPSIA